MHYTSGTTPNYLIDFGEDFENGFFLSHFKHPLFSPSFSFLPTFLCQIFFDKPSDCTYSVGVEVIFSTKSSATATREVMILADGRG